MVRLKEAAVDNERERTVFQFHYGTIKSPEFDKAVDECLLFQFHYGTIKRYLCFYKPVKFTHFNSTMVRLKGYQNLQNPL